MSRGLQLLKPWSPTGDFTTLTGFSSKKQPWRRKVHTLPRMSQRRGQVSHMGKTTRSMHLNSSSVLVDHLNKTFPPLQFPPDLATRLLTHASHSDATLYGHNARLAFAGRRVLELYFLLFLHSCPDLRPDDDYKQLVARVFNTYMLGEHVAPKWSLGNVLRWSPAPGVMAPTNSSTGLHKVQGTTVEAIVGGIYHQFGASVAQRLFHTCVLPHLLLRGTGVGLQDVYHDHAMKLFRRMGGDKQKLQL